MYPNLHVNLTLVHPFVENLGESELREALLKKAEYLATIGDKAAAIEVGAWTEIKQISLSYGTYSM